MFGLATLAIVLVCDAMAAQEAPEKGCIEIAHIGSQDTPVGRLRLCVGEKGRSHEDSLLENEWTFYFDVTMYQRLDEFVVKHRPDVPVSIGSGPESSFAVTWPSKDGKRKYIISPKMRCIYLAELIHTVGGREYADFRRVGENVMVRERCRLQPN